MKMTWEQFMGKLADDVWTMANKTAKLKGGGSHIARDLKLISTCLHDLRARRSVDWYEKRKFS